VRDGGEVFGACAEAGTSSRDDRGPVERDAPLAGGLSAAVDAEERDGSDGDDQGGHGPTRDTAGLWLLPGLGQDAADVVGGLAAEDTRCTPHVIEEVLRNLPSLRLDASSDWIHLRADLIIQDDVVTLDYANVFAAAKDRPILFSALAWADTLLTLDRGTSAASWAANSMGSRSWRRVPFSSASARRDT
jgi:hypothetical protein